jgi:hypothetical protein
MATPTPKKTVYEQWVYNLAIIHAVLSLILLIAVSTMKIKAQYVIPLFLFISFVVCAAIATLSMKDKKIKSY